MITFDEIYFEAIDLIRATIDSIFQQKVFSMLQKLETILTTQQHHGSEVVKEVITFYGTDFSHLDRLETHLTLLRTNVMNQPVSLKLSLSVAAPGGFLTFLETDHDSTRSLVPIYCELPCQDE
jgi:hypothetical protein